MAKLNEEKLTAEKLREVLDYDPGTGAFRWRRRANASASWNTRWAGKPAGAAMSNGYILIRIDGLSYLAHRLAWLYVYGEWPSDNVDHINWDRGDNRIANLRNATLAQNGWNMRPRPSKSGIKGVYRVDQSGKWRARINVASVTHHLGCFDCLGQAVNAYRSAVRQHFAMGG